MNKNSVTLKDGTIAYKHPNLRNYMYGTTDGKIISIDKNLNSYEYKQKIAWRKYASLNSGKMVHRVVCECFYGMLIPDGFVIDHVDGDPKIIIYLIWKSFLIKKILKGLKISE